MPASPRSKVSAIIAGATLLALALVAVFIPTALDLTLENWFRLGLIYATILFVFLCAGVALIVLPFVAKGKTRIKVLVAILVFGLAITWFAAGRQLAYGPVETVGVIEEINGSKKRDGFVFDPMNMRAKLHRPRKHDQISIREPNGAESTITLVRADTDRLLAFSTEQGRPGPYRIVMLRHFKRLLSIEATASR